MINESVQPNLISGQQAIYISRVVGFVYFLLTERTQTSDIKESLCSKEPEEEHRQAGGADLFPKQRECECESDRRNKNQGEPTAKLSQFCRDGEIPEHRQRERHEIAGTQRVTTYNAMGITNTRVTVAGKESLKFIPYNPLNVNTRGRFDAIFTKYTKYKK